jgi:hypothetical protein
LGPFTITEVDYDRSNVTLDLPPTMRIHPTFHMSSVKPWRNPSAQFPTRTTHPQPPPEIIDGDEHFEVDNILDFKIVRKKYMFLVRWQGYGDSHNTWEPAANLSHCQDIMRAFLDRTPQCDYHFAAVKELQHSPINAARLGVRHINKSPHKGYVKQINFLLATSTGNQDSRTSAGGSVRKERYPRIGSRA